MHRRRFQLNVKVFGHIEHIVSAIGVRLTSAVFTPISSTNRTDQSICCIFVTAFDIRKQVFSIILTYYLPLEPDDLEAICGASRDLSSSSASMLVEWVGHW